jgi:uncharacterized protein
MRSRLTTVIGLFFWLAAALLPIGSWSRQLFGPLWGSEVLWLGLIVAVYGYVLFVEGRSLSSIGFRRLRWLDIVLGVVVGFLMVVGIILVWNVLFPLLHLKMNMTEMESILNTPFWYRFLTVTRAAVAEETLFRGYGIERISEWSGSRILAAVITWAAFTYAHLRAWGWAHLLVVGFAGLLLTVLFVWRRSLWANMLAHWLTDAAGFLLPH